MVLLKKYYLFTIDLAIVLLLFLTKIYSLPLLTSLIIATLIIYKLLLLYICIYMPEHKKLAFYCFYFISISIIFILY